MISGPDGTTTSDVGLDVQGGFKALLDSYRKDRPPFQWPE
jgi:hypothetical protein